MTRAAANASHGVVGQGGVMLSVKEYGDAQGRPIVLLHGFSQSHLSWARQVESGPLAETYRLIVPDMRGHGMSDKPPASKDTYGRSEPFARDIAAILSELSLERPVLVGWSMGGIWLNDYLRICGPDKIGGLALVGSFSATGPHSPPKALAAREADPAVMARGMMSDDLSENLVATRAFVEACFATPPGPEDLADMMAFNMLCPPGVRAAVRPRKEDYRNVLAGCGLPALVLHGALDRIVPLAFGAQSAETIPNAEYCVYERSGHAPFWEEPDRFNADLARFAARCFGEDA